jgi:hypothetical protein
MLQIWPAGHGPGACAHDPVLHVSTVQSTPSPHCESFVHPPDPEPVDALLEDAPPADALLEEALLADVLLAGAPPLPEATLDGPSPPAPEADTFPSVSPPQPATARIVRIAMRPNQCVVVMKEFTMRRILGGR